MTDREIADLKCPECGAINRTHGRPCIDRAPSMAADLDYYRRALTAARASSPPSPGLVEAARDAVVEAAVAWGESRVDDEASSNNLLRALKALRAALPKETP